MTRTEALIAAIRARIANRALNAGDRLPSIRRFAATMGVSPSTVVEAYGRLEAEGVIRARRGAGFFVTGADLPPMALAEMGPARARRRSVLGLPPVARCGAVHSQAGLRLAAGRLDAECGAAQGAEGARPRRRHGFIRLWRHARFAGPAPAAARPVRR